MNIGPTSNVNISDDDIRLNMPISSDNKNTVSSSNITDINSMPGGHGNMEDMEDMEKNEEQTLENLKACRSIIDPYIEEFGGKIDLVFDDRNKVVDMWRARGTTVVQVAEGDF